MEAIFVGTHHPAGNLLEILISGNDDALGHPNRADRALGKAGGLEFFVVQQLEASENAIYLDLVELVITRDEYRNNLAFFILAYERFHGCSLIDAKEFSQRRNGGNARRGDLLHGSNLIFLGLRDALSHFGVRRHNRS